MKKFKKFNKYNEKVSNYKIEFMKEINLNN